MSALPAPKLSVHQTRLLDHLFEQKPNVFLTGRAGTGKTTLMREFLRRAGSRAAVLAPTGVAAMQAGGTTVPVGTPRANAGAGRADASGTVEAVAAARRVAPPTSFGVSSLGKGNDTSHAGAVNATRDVQRAASSLF